METYVLALVLISLLTILYIVGEKVIKIHLYEQKEKAFNKRKDEILKEQEQSKHLSTEKGNDILIRNAKLQHLASSQNNDIAKVNNLFKKAEMLVSSGNLQEGHKLCVQALSLNPEHLGTKKQMAIIYVKENKHSRAEEVLKDLIVNHKIKEKEVFLNLSKCLLEQQKLDEAYSYMDHLVSLDPKDHKIHVFVGKIHLGLDELVKAKTHLDHAINLEKKNVEYKMLMFKVLKKMELANEAEAILNEVLNLKPYHEIAVAELKKLQKNSIS